MPDSDANSDASNAMVALAALHPQGYPYDDDSLLQQVRVTVTGPALRLAAAAVAHWRAVRTGT
jgi:hypothetical protein